MSDGRGAGVTGPVGYLKVVSPHGKTSPFDVFPFRDDFEDERKARTAAEVRARTVHGKVVSWGPFAGVPVVGDSP